ncbi:MAG: lysine--tRNA ligase [Verrucomicrobiota bacterium]
MKEELSELLALRREKLEKLKALGIDPFGEKFPDTESSASILASFAEGKKARFAGRVMTHRDMGKSHFIHLQDEKGKLQIYIKPAELSAKEADVFKLIDIGDFIGVDGTLFSTKTGEKTVRVEKLTFLTKSLLPLPDKWHGLTDVEARYRQRYLDLISNPEVKATMMLRTRIVKDIRNYFERRGFTEVETPMMQAIAGGAAAQPFKTHHKALNMDLYLRIAPELYLKRLLVGGFERVFEINRNFRNEGISRKHNPEFTMLEAYWAYANFEDIAALVEDLICELAMSLHGELKIKHGDAEINLQRPWKRKKYRDCVKEAAGKDWFDLKPQQRKEKAEKLGVEISEKMEDFEVTQQIFEKLVEAKTIDPIFVTHLPKELVPLAKQNKENPDLVDVYELIMNGQEISPGYSELNDPITQRKRLEAQAGEETQKLDEDFLLALEHGMPPAAGFGIGIDRLVMTLTGSESIRDVILFPLLKPKD